MTGKFQEKKETDQTDKRRFQKWKKCRFIKTSDEEVAEIFRQAGYPEMNKEGSQFVFVNIGRFENGEFSTVPVDKCTFSRTVCL